MHIPINYNMSNFLSDPKSKCEAKDKLDEVDGDVSHLYVPFRIS